MSFRLKSRLVETRWANGGRQISRFIEANCRTPSFIIISHVSHCDHQLLCKKPKKKPVNKGEEEEEEGGREYFNDDCNDIKDEEVNTDPDRCHFGLKCNSSPDKKSPTFFTLNKLYST